MMSHCYLEYDFKLETGETETVNLKAVSVYRA